MLLNKQLYIKKIVVGIPKQQDIKIALKTNNALGTYIENKLYQIGIKFWWYKVGHTGRSFGNRCLGHRKAFLQIKNDSIYVKHLLEENYICEENFLIPDTKEINYTNMNH